MNAKKYEIGLAVSKFYPDLSLKLEQGVYQFFKKTEGYFEFHVASSPGSTELPLTADWLFQYKKCSAVIVLGIVIRGETSHYNSVCRMLEYGIMNVQLKRSKPVINGVIMAENVDQVKKRLSHIGQISAESCLRMLKSFDKLYV